MANTDHIYWTLMMTLSEGQDAAFETLMAEMVTAAQAEAGCLAYEWHRAESAVHLYERYRSNADAGIHMKNFQEHFAKRFFGMLSVSGFHVYGPVEDPLRAGLEKAGAKIYASVGGFAR